MYTADEKKNAIQKYIDNNYNANYISSGYVM